MIYVPDTDNYECFVVQNDSTIRAYEEVPRQNSTIKYRDYYVTSNYIYRDGVQTFSQYANNIPICLVDEVITTDFEYRNDFDSILIIFVIMCLFGFYLPWRILKRLFRRVG